METNAPPVLVTLTAPTAAGKSYLFNYIRDVAKLPCLISTTTRSPRAGEVEGVDYYFISEEESKRLEAEDQLAELATYNGVRYGVTKKEFHSKLSQGLAFLIVEPSGIDHYVKPAKDVGALHYKAYVHVDPELRLRRFQERCVADMRKAMLAFATPTGAVAAEGLVIKQLNTALSRMKTMLTEEMQWGTMHDWDRTLFGTENPKANLDIILKDVENLKKRHIETETDKERLRNQAFKAQWDKYSASRSTN